MVYDLMVYKGVIVWDIPVHDTGTSLRLESCCHRRPPSAMNMAIMDSVPC